MNAIAPDFLGQLEERSNPFHPGFTGDNVDDFGDGLFLGSPR